MGVAKIFTRFAHAPVKFRCRILIRKLNFLAKLLDKSDALSAQVFRTLACDDVYKVSLVQQCRSLEQLFGTNYLQQCLSNPSEACLIVREAKVNILEKDWEHTIIQTKSHPSLAIVSATNGIASGWNSVWDEAFEHGVQGTKFMQTLFSALLRPVFGDRICPHCGESISAEQSYPQHLVSHHLTGFDIDSIIDWIENKNFDHLFQLADAISSLHFHGSVS